MKSAAVVNYAPEKGSVEIREIEKPEIGDEDVLLEVANVGVCGSDLHQWTADHSWPVNYPVVLGHEFAGTIVETGSRVSQWEKGDRVVSETAAIIDANNPMSKAGFYNLDPTRKGFGYGVNGAMTQFVRVPARCLHHLPDQLSFEHACLTEPCCVAYNAVVENTGIKPGDRVMVLGPGTIGILCAAVAKISGAEVAVVGLEADKTRLNIASQYGCETITRDATEWAQRRDGLGADVIIDAAGVSVTLQLADAVGQAERKDHQSWLGTSAIRLFTRSDRSKKYNTSRQFQPQLADLGKSYFFIGKRTIGCKTNHWRHLANQ